MWQERSAPEALDVFFFDTSGVQPLDAYQRLTGLEGVNYGLSGMGAKRLVVLSDPSSDRTWLDIATYGNLCKHVFSIERESPERPLLAGEALLEDGMSRYLNLPLKTMLASIRIHSVACDFSGRPYETQWYDNEKLFLTYAPAEFLPLAPEGGRVVSWINQGDVDSVAIGRLKCPEMVLQTGYGPIRKERIQEEKTFYCYATEGDNGDLPMPRLVMQGNVAGKTCYYPIPLPSLMAGVCYQLDITIRRMGTDSPDIPVESGTVVLETQTLPWEDRASYTVIY